MSPPQRKETPNVADVAVSSMLNHRVPNGKLKNDAQSPDNTDRAPTDLPPFTIGDIRRAIPEHCFQRSYLKSFGYLIFDLAIVVGLWTLANHIDARITNDAIGAAAPYVRSFLWVTYWIVQGCVMTGLWVIGHECGHGGFSDSSLVNDTVGLAVHTSLLVPYFSWKISHRKHHSNTGSLDRDEVFVPQREDEVDVDSTLMWSVPVRTLQTIFFALAGWFAYLFFNATGHKFAGHKWVNHFSPSSPIFAKHERHLVIISDIALLVVLGVLYAVGSTYGFMWLTKMYIIPYLITNYWLVSITLLQHTDLTLPHFGGSEWEWLRGALCTIDRNFGILNIVFHHIQDTHVVHHLFSSMPHYNAEEATRAVIPLLGKYYRFHDTGALGSLKAVWDCFAQCHYVAREGPVSDKKNKEEGVFWFKTAKHTGVFS